MSVAIIDATYRTSDELVDGISRSRYTMPIGNVPLISHVVGDLAAGGVSRARIVAAGDERAGLEGALAAGGERPFPVEVVEAPRAAPRRGVLAELDAALGGERDAARGAEPVLLHPGDGLCPGLPGAMRERYRDGDVDLVLSAGRSEAGDGRLSDSALLLGPRTRSLVAELLRADDDGANLTETLLHGDLRLAVCEGGDGWSYESSTARLLAGNRRVLDRLPDERRGGELADGNELHGRISVGRDVRASGCVIHGPVAIADGVVLEDCHVGPFTALGPCAVLRGTEIDDTIVLAGAEIRHPGHRITASIIGEHARVERSFELPRGVQLRLGPHSRLRFH